MIDKYSINITIRGYMQSLDDNPTMINIIWHKVVVIIIHFSAKCLINLLILLQGQHISLDNQLQNHLITISRILNITRSNESTFKHLNNCFYYVGMGSNDYLNNFEQGLVATVPGKFANELVQQYSRQIKVSRLL